MRSFSATTLLRELVHQNLHQLRASVGTERHGEVDLEHQAVLQRVDEERGGMFRMAA